MTANSVPSIKVILADDDEDDGFLIRRALDRISTDIELQTVRDGEQLLEILRARFEGAGTQAAAWPDLILLDLNMPCMDGREALAAIKSDPRLRRIPVLILTTSSAAQDIEQCYDLGANSYLVKPSAFDVLLDVLQRVMDYWTDLVSLPPRGGWSARP